MEPTQNIVHPREAPAFTERSGHGAGAATEPDSSADSADGAIAADARPHAAASGRTVSAPATPRSLEEAGLSQEFVAGLVAKTLHVRGATVGFDLSDMLALPLSLIDDVIQELQERRFVEVHSTKGPSRGEYVFTLTSAGRKRAAEEMEISRYVGPAPVSFQDFRRWIWKQTVEGARVSEEELREVLDGVELPESMIELLGPAINSGRSMFLYGESGNGKTFLADRISRVFGERYYVPHSVLVDGSVMIVYDPVHHGAPSRDGNAVSAGTANGSSSAPDEGSGDMRQEIVRSVPDHDPRYVEARRPVVVTGGELTLEQLDLQWDPTGRMYQAPPQLKAAGGVLVVDDLGRQRVPVRDLLNRWVVPLEHRRDYMTLRSGRKMVVPFDCFVIFSTNLEPRSLTDEAFLRRIHYKIEMPDPHRDEYERIFRRCCEARDIEYDERALDYLYDELYAEGKVQPRRCHPRDVLDHVRDLAEYRGEPARLSTEAVAQACRSYFPAFGLGTIPAHGLSMVPTEMKR